MFWPIVTRATTAAGDRPPVSVPHARGRSWERHSWHPERRSTQCSGQGGGEPSESSDSFGSADQGPRRRTVNDVVMALCAGALQEWLADHGAPAGHCSPVYRCPAVLISTPRPTATRCQDRRSASGRICPNRRAAPRRAYRDGCCRPVPLGTNPDVLTALYGRMRGTGCGQSGEPTGEPIRLLERLRPLNLFISMLPGPPVRDVSGRRIRRRRLSAVHDRRRQGVSTSP